MDQPVWDPESDAPTGIEEADIALSEQLTTQRRHPVIQALGAIGELGDQPPLVAFSAGVLAFGLLSGRGRTAAAGANMLMSLGIAIAAKTAVKKTISRTRPNVLLDEGTYQVEPLGPDEGPWHSMPSGHTAGSVAVACALARTVPEAALPAYAAATAVAAVQLPTAHHFLSDIVVGAAIGIGADMAAARIARQAQKLLDGQFEADGEAGPEPG
jgi:membrane-associated phospholipid phosphatase